MCVCVCVCVTLCIVDAGWIWVKVKVISRDKRIRPRIPDPTGCGLDEPLGPDATIIETSQNDP